MGGLQQYFSIKTMGPEYGPLVWNPYMSITYRFRVRAHTLKPTRTRKMQVRAQITADAKILHDCMCTIYDNYYNDSISFGICSHAGFLSSTVGAHRLRIYDIPAPRSPSLGASSEPPLSPIPQRGLGSGGGGGVGGWLPIKAR